MTEINIDPYQHYPLNDSLTINSEYFGNIVFKYTIINIKTNKFLRYKIGENPKVYMVDYNIIEKEITLHEYFRNALKYLYLQLEQIRKYEEIANDLEGEEKELIDYLDELNKNYLKK